MDETSPKKEPVSSAQNSPDVGPEELSSKEIRSDELAPRKEMILEDGRHIEWKTKRLHLIRNLAYFGGCTLLLALGIVQTLKYRIEMKRLDIESARIPYLAPAGMTSGLTPPPLAQVPQNVPPPVAGIDALRGLIEVLPVVIPAAKEGKRSMLEDLVGGVTQGLVKAGKATAEEAGTLRKRIIEAAINVGEDAAKEVIRSFLREKEGDKPAVAEKSSVGGVGNHVEITFNGQKDYLTPRFIVQPAPKPKPSHCGPAPCAQKSTPCLLSADSKSGNTQELLCSAPPATSTPPATSATSSPICPTCQPVGH